MVAVDMPYSNRNPGPDVGDIPPATLDIPWPHRVRIGFVVCSYNQRALKTLGIQASVALALAKVIEARRVKLFQMLLG